MQSEEFSEFSQIRGACAQSGYRSAVLPPRSRSSADFIMETRTMLRKLFLPGSVWFVGFLLAVAVSAVTNKEWLMLLFFVLLIA
jgi:CHASE1-domain containing sensor protein